MRLPKFEYIEPKTLKEASRALTFDIKGSVLLAGGTDLLVLMKQRLIQPTRVINLKAIPGLSHISEGKDGLRIGSINHTPRPRMFHLCWRSAILRWSNPPGRLELMVIR